MTKYWRRYDHAIVYKHVVPSQYHCDVMYHYGDITIMCIFPQKYWMIILLYLL